MRTWPRVAALAVLLLSTLAPRLSAQSSTPECADSTLASARRIAACQALVRRDSTSAEARWRLDPSDIGRLATLQRELFTEAAARTRPGGLLVYSVCTFTREETLDIDSWATETFPELTAVPAPGAPWRPSGRGALLLPTAAGTDGMFMLRLRAPA